MAIEDVRARLLRSTAALERHGVPYAVAGGNAVAEWIGRVDQSAVRFTQDVDLLIRRADLPLAIKALTDAGFVYHESLNIPLFLDGPKSGPRDAVHVVFSGELLKPNDALPTPEVDASEAAAAFRVVTLESLVIMKLTAYRRKDQVHLLDLLSVGLIDSTWLSRLTPELSRRLQELIDNPDS